MGWAVLADTVPIYPLYALLFVSTGLSDVEVSALFAIRSAVAVVAEIPFGAFADRFSRKWSVVGAGVCQAAGYAPWTSLPGFTGFAVGFVLWGVGGAMSSGAVEALLHDGSAPHRTSGGCSVASRRSACRPGSVSIFRTRMPAYVYLTTDGALPRTPPGSGIDTRDEVSQPHPRVEHSGPECRTSRTPEFYVQDRAARLER
ncbi:MFS transporter [Saccharothrix saharensis]|uniref:MFS transporter n=1 Tax=Saccharothrix saharensis TaxID=571190 RepID=A0A543JJD1_9PSEU|nr:MFS transporter [Saccharothrix saharensis]